MQTRKQKYWHRKIVTTRHIVFHSLFTWMKVILGGFFILFGVCGCSPLQFFTSGGGSKAWRDDINWMDPKELKFYYDGQGFMSLEITESQAKFVFFDIFGNVLHQWTSSNQLLHSSIWTQHILNSLPQLLVYICVTLSMYLWPFYNGYMQFKFYVYSF